MIMNVTADIGKFGWLELSKLRDILNAWMDTGLPDGFEQDEVHPEFNMNSGYVFLTNSEYQVAMLNGDRLELFYTCGSCGHEGLREDFDHNSNDCCKEYMKDYGIDLDEDEV